MLLYNKLTQNYCRVGTSTALVIGLVIVSSPTVQADGKLSREAIQQWARASLAKGYAWFNSPWTGDDQPYQNIRSRIDQALARGQKPTAVLQTYRAFAQQQPNSSQAIFGYGYAVYKAETLPNGLSEAEALQDGNQVYEAWEKVRTLPAYNFARLMFLHESLSSPTPDLIAVGKRLLARSPNDYEAEYGLALMANVSSKASDRSQAVAYQQDLARRFPNDPRHYRLLAVIHQTNAIRTHNQAEADKAITAYQQYIALAPEYRTKIEDNIRMERELQAMWRSG